VSPWPLLALLVLPAAAADAPADRWEDPTAAETALFARLQRRFAAHAPGEPVEDAQRSLSEEVRVSFDCKKAVVLRTRLKKWRPERGEDDGWYEWASGPSRREGGVEVEAFENVVAFDASKLSEERSRRQRVDAAALYYHELLHAQLLINAMKGDARWKKAYCESGAFDTSPADFERHRAIPDLERAYADGLWNKVKDLRDWD
jgi:hypothetical protein